MPGPFYFAWVGPTDTSFLPEFIRFDEDVYAFVVTHQEGEFPALDLKIKNPRVGLLAPGRKVWAWLSWNQAAPGAPEDVIPLFFGRLIGLPQELQNEVLGLSLVARPIDFESQKNLLAETLKVAPYWDPIFLTAEQRDIPDSVLEARTQRWHIDRVTHDLSVSDIITGEDGTIEYSASGRLLGYDGLGLSFGEPPLRKVTVEAELSWKQSCRGTVDLTDAVSNVFKHAGSGEGYIVTSYTGSGLVSDWPKHGANIGSGWKVGSAAAARFDTPYTAIFFVSDVIKEEVLRIATGALAVPLKPLLGTFVGQDNSRILLIPLWRLSTSLSVDFDVSRTRKEVVSFDLVADTQPLLTDPSDAEVAKISVNSQDVGIDIDLGDTDDTSAIGDIRRAYYLPLERGRQSLTFLILLARVQMLARARTARVNFATTFADAIDLSCRKNALAIDPRLPGGQAAGKIVEYSFELDGQTGRMIGNVQIACCIGRGGTVVAAEGDPTYAEEGYAELGYQAYSGALIMPLAGEVTYGDFFGPNTDDYDGVDFFDMTSATTIDELSIANGAASQAVAVLAANEAAGRWQEPAQAFEALNALPTRVHLEMVPLERGPFTARYDIVLSALKIPKTIDLEA